MSFWNDVSIGVLGVILAPVLPGERIFVLYMLTSLAIAFLSFLSLRMLEAGNRPDKVEKGFWAFVFDKDIFAHKSSIQDYKYFLFNGVIYYGLITQFLLGMHVFANVFLAGMNYTFGPLGTPLIDITPLTAFLYTFAVVLLADFAVYYLHYLHHRIPFLWAFHKVHHSAEVLNPITLYRMHPVDLALTGMASSALAALAFAGFFYLSGREFSEQTLLGVNIITFLFYIFGYNLRHSHVWFNYPKWLSYILVSPAQHQIHHSSDPKHFDKNMGLIFSFWDHLFGTLYIPKAFEKLKYGLSRKNPNPYKTVQDLYVMPMTEAWNILTGRSKDGQTSAALIVGVIITTMVYSSLFVWDKYVYAARLDLPSVYMEDLTWAEVKNAQDHGYTNVIIPTGGTEQNGRHVILGKHNYIIHYTGGEIAEKLGNILVAPVMAYVPEGNPEQKAGHMAYPGTVSVPDNIFESVLTAAATSYKTHGFKTIFILGDSGDSVKAQESVAKTLSEKWKQDGVQVIHVSDYYSKNGQMDWLKAQGFQDGDIGSHAGMRDTSELLAVHKDGVHFKPGMRGTPGQSGSNGQYELATEEIGRKMLDLKIQAAINQMRPNIKVNESTKLSLSEGEAGTGKELTSFPKELVH